MSIRHSWIALGALSTLTWACSEDVDSEDIRTSGIYAEMTVVATGNGSSEVTVDLTVGGDDSNTHLDVKGEDSLEVTADGNTEDFDQDGNEYEATLDVDEGGTEFVIAFLRGDEDDDAPDSTVILPEGFDLEAPEELVGRDELVVVTWSPDGEGDMRWTADGECIFDELGQSTPDDGELELGEDDLDFQSSYDEDTCRITVCLERYASGRVDEGFDGGRVEALQRRCADVDLTL